ncbi:MAG: M56 family metallopeptidase, partial [Gramella sp.]|nr:M56 family metallopeptidase [Christiangramia sp.]
LGRFAKNLKSLLQDIKSNKKFRKLNYVFVLLERKISPYTFLNYIFLNRTEYRNNAISKAILEHEKVHVDQRHSLDLLIVEFIQIFFWFNPIFHWIKRSMKLNHEYLADEGVINKEIDAVQYSGILCNYSSGHYHNILSSPMSQSLIKKRIIMISKTFSIRKLTLRLGLLVPVLVFCLYFFNNEIKAKPVLATTEAEMIFKNKMIQDPNIISIKIKEAKLYVNGDQTPVNEFAQVIDSKIAGKNDEDLQEMGIEMKMIDPDEKFVELVNSEFKKSRLAKLTGMSMLPPPPPLPPNPDAAARPPKAPSATKGKNVEIKEEVTIENGKKKIIKEKIITGEKYKVEKEIENLPKDADYYVNDKKVERSEALNVMENSKVLRVDIKKEDGDKDIVKIYTE